MYFSKISWLGTPGSLHLPAVSERFSADTDYFLTDSGHFPVDTEYFLTDSGHFSTDTKYFLTDRCHFSVDTKYFFTDSGHFPVDTKYFFTESELFENKSDDILTAGGFFAKELLPGWEIADPRKMRFGNRITRYSIFSLMSNSCWTDFLIGVLIRVIGAIPGW